MCLAFRTRRRWWLKALQYPKVNTPRLVGTEDGTVLGPTYNWQKFFSPAYRPLLGIKPMGHFRFSADHPGMVFYRTTIADAKEMKQLAIQQQLNRLAAMPNVLPSPLVSRERQRYVPVQKHSGVGPRRCERCCLSQPQLSLDVLRHGSQGL